MTHMSNTCLGAVILLRDLMDRRRDGSDLRVEVA